MDILCTAPDVSFIFTLVLFKLTCLGGVKQCLTEWDSIILRQQAEPGVFQLQKTLYV